MAGRQFILNLAKLVVAAAWTDGKLETAEINALKDLLFEIPDLSGEEWARLEIYMDSPVSPEERERLLSLVLDGARSGRDRKLVLETLQRLVESDGHMTEGEASLLEDAKKALNHEGKGFLSKLKGVTGSAVRKRARNRYEGPNREQRLEDFLKNRLYFQFVSEMERGGVKMDLPEETVRKICLAAGLMAKVAHADEEISQEEQGIIKEMLMKEWELPDHAASICRDISLTGAGKGLDSVQWTRSFFECTTAEERKRLLLVLFQVANAAHRTSNEEIEKIRRIAKSLRISHGEFIEAKLTIPRDDRHGL